MTKTEKRRTNQKNTIREALFRMDNHPTASMVAEELSGEVHKASRATVFRVLADAAEEGRISRIQLLGEDVRYDYKTDPHYHLHCVRCGRIWDSALPYDFALDAAASLNGFLVESHLIEFRGICEECRQREGNENGSQSDL